MSGYRLFDITGTPAVIGYTLTGWRINCMSLQCLGYLEKFSDL